MQTSNAACLCRDALSRYVTGALDGAEQSRVERHVLACTACAAGLTREARLEMALFELGEQAMPATSALPSPIACDLASDLAFGLRGASTEATARPRLLVSRRRRWLAPIVSACAAATFVLLVNAWSVRSPSAAARSTDPDVAASPACLDGGFPG